MPKNFFLNKTIAVIFVAAVSVSFSAGWYLGTNRGGPSSDTYASASLVDVTGCRGTDCASNFSLVPNVFNTNTGKPENVDFAPFWRVWQLLNDRYVNGTAAVNSTSTKKATNQDRVWGAISGMVGAVGDPYTVFMPPQEKSRFEEDIRGNFSGVGMEVGYKDGIPTVISPLPNTPAKKAGILAGDRVLKIDGTSTAGLSLDEAINKIRGKAGTAVVLTILHENSEKPVDIKIVREVITIPTIDTKTVTGKNGEKIGVISLYNFSAQSSDLFNKAINNFAKSGSNKLILDLRGNPGGYLDAAVDMASWFLPQGKVIVRESYGTGKPEKTYRSAGYDIFKNKNLKMVVLVDKGSASASEILAGALSEYKVAKLVGEKTFGKGSVQELIPVTKDSSLKVTIARWLTPNGKSISQNGLEPDYAVKLAEKTATSTPKDIQMDKALELLK